MTPSLEDFNGATLVIEAAPEKLELKRDIFKQLDAICGAGDASGDQYFLVQRHGHRGRAHSIRNEFSACTFLIRRR